MSFTLMWLALAPSIVSVEPTVDFLWVRRGEGSAPTRAAGVAADGHGNAYILETSGATGSAKYLHLAKFDRTGMFLWVRNVVGGVYNSEGEPTSWGNKLALDKAGNAYVTGNASAGRTGDITLTNRFTEAFLAKYDSNGTLAWSTTGLGGLSSSIAVNDRGHICVTGGSGKEIFITKCDSEGHLLWTRYAGDEASVWSLGVALDRFGNSIITGSFQQKIKFGDTQLIDGSGGDIFVAKYDADGNPVWALGGEGPGNRNTDWGTGVAVNSDGHIYVTGAFQGNTSFAGGSLTALNSSGSHLFVAKLDNAGSLQWISQSGPKSTGAEGRGIAVDVRGDIYVTGFFGGSESFGSINLGASGPGDMFIAKYRPNGNLLWVKQAGGIDADSGRSVATDEHGNAYIAGEFGLFQSNSPAVFGQSTLTARGQPDVFLLKTGVAPVLVNGQIGYGFELKDTHSDLKSVEVRLQTRFENGSIFYTLDGTQPTFVSAKYMTPFKVERSVMLRMIAYDTSFNSEEFDPVPINFLRNPLNLWTLGGGAIQGNPPNDFFREDAVVQLTAVPDTGWSFLNWSGDASGTNAVINLTMERSKTVQAIFGTAVKTNPVGSGSVLLAPQLSLYPYGTSVRVTAVPSRQAFFALWGGDSSGNDNPLTFSVNTANPTISALFSPLAVGRSSLVVLTTGKGDIELIPKSNVYTNGQAVTVRAIPRMGQEFLSWSGDAVGKVNPLVVVMNGSRVITANFSGASYLVRIDTTRILSNGSFQLGGISERGDRLRVQTSQNLASWSDLATLTNYAGYFQFTDTSVNTAVRFYRIIGD